MLVSRPEGFLPIQVNSARTVGTSSADRTQPQDGRFDHISLSNSGTQTDSSNFRQLVSQLSHQVRTYNTTGKIQELRAQVSNGTYRISPKEIAAGMLLMKEDV